MSQDILEGRFGFAEAERAEIVHRVGELRRTWSRDGSTVPAATTRHNDPGGSGAGPVPIEIQPAAEQRARWEAAARTRGQTLEDFTVSAIDAAAVDAVVASEPDDVNAELVARVCQALRLQDLDDEQLAGVAATIDIDPDRFAMGVRGERMFTGLQLALIAEAGNTTVYWLLTGQERRRTTR